MKRLQETEFETYCKSLDTALRRFEKKHPAVASVWLEHIRYMAENGQEQDDAREEAGYVVWAIVDDGFFYFCVIAYTEAQVIQ